MNERLGSHRLLDGLPPPDRARVLSAVLVRRYDTGETVFLHGDPSDGVYLLTDGRVAVRTTTPDGESTTFAVLGPGDLFGEMAVLSDARRSSAIVALEPVRVLLLPAAALNQLRRENPAVNDLLLNILAARIRRLSRHLVEARHEPADRRIVRRVIELCHVYGQGSDAVHIPLPQSDIAALAGTTRQSVNRRLRALQDEGALRLSRSAIEVDDWHRLLAYA